MKDTEAHRLAGLESENSDVEVWRKTSSQRPDSDVLISLVVPVLCEEKILRRSLAILDPALREQYHMELIVSDGGSSDASIAIAQEYADAVVQFKAARRQTIAEGRNCGASAARGQVLVFINADTFPAEPTVFFEHIHQWTLGKGKYLRNVALACPVEVNPSERKWSDVLFHTFFNNYLKVLSMLNIGVGRGECQIVKKETFFACGGYNSSLAAGEDFDFFSRISRRHSIAIANELLVYESPRRYRRYGYMRILWSWLLNWIGATFFSKSVSKEWEVVR